MTQSWGFHAPWKSPVGTTEKGTVPQALTYLGCFSSNLPQNRHPERSASQIYRVVQRWARSRRTSGGAFILLMPLAPFQPPKPTPGGPATLQRFSTVLEMEDDLQYM